MDWKDKYTNTMGYKYYNKIFAKRFLLIYFSIIIILFIAISNAYAGISPNNVNYYKKPGECYTELKTVEIPGTTIKVDIVFAFDLTSSMGEILSTAKSNIGQIMENLINSNSGVSFNFGVISYMDYPAFYISCGYRAAYADPITDYPYNLNQPLTDITTEVSNAISGLSLGDGWDPPEDYTRIFYESYNDSNIGWRTDAQKILINFADSVPHNCNLNESIYDGIWSTGVDPGPDGIILNGDDLYLLEVLSAMNTSGITLIECHSSNNYFDYWEYWTGLTGGSVNYTNSSNFVNVVDDAITNKLMIPKIYDLHLEVTTLGFESWLSSVTPSSYTEVIMGATVTFEETICVPIGTPPGEYTFVVSAVDEEGNNYGDQTNVVTVNAPPVAYDDNVVTDEDVSIWINILGNDIDTDGYLDPATVLVTNNPSYGTTILNQTTGEIRYTPNADYYGIDSFTYTVDDDYGETSNEATVTITVESVNDAPVAYDDVDFTDEDTLVWVDVLGNDVDVDGTLDPASVDVTGYPSNGTTVVNLDTGEIGYVPDSDFFGVDSFTYIVDDNDGASSNEATVTITVNSMNDPPVITTVDVTSASEDVLYYVDYEAFDAEFDVLTWSVESDAGFLTIDPNTGVLSGTPMDVDVGSYYVNVSVYDGMGGFDFSNFTLVVSETNDPPYAPTDPDPDDGQTGVETSPILNVLVDDPEDDVLNVSFYDNLDNLIGVDIDVPSGTIASITWNGLGYSTAYTWYAVANDTEYITKSQLWTFTTKAAPSSPGSSNSKPVADASAGAPYLGVIGEEITFDGSNSYDPDPDGYINSWYWYFDDGKYENGEIVTHSFTEPDIYQVSLTVTDNKGAEDTITFDVEIIIANNPPTDLTVDGPTKGNQNEYYEYSASAIDLDEGDMLRFIFDWGDGTSTTSGVVNSGITATVTHNWSTYGVYEVKVTAEDNYSAQISTTFNVYIDIIVIDDDIKGFIIDQDGNDPFDVFDNTETNDETDVELDSGSYLIDSDGDGKWDYAYSEESGLISYYMFVYHKYLIIYQAQKSTPGFELVVLLAAIVIAALIVNKKRKNK